jgi:hypothetical protein
MREIAEENGMYAPFSFPSKKKLGTQRAIDETRCKIGFIVVRFVVDCVILFSVYLLNLVDLDDDSSSIGRCIFLLHIFLTLLWCTFSEELTHFNSVLSLAIL